MFSSKPLALTVLGIVVAAVSFMVGRMSVATGEVSQSETGTPRGAVRSASGTGAMVPLAGSRSAKSGDARRHEGSGSPGSSRTAAGPGTGTGTSAEGAEDTPRELSWTEKLLEKKGLSVFDEDYELNPDLKEVLGLSDAEFGTLTQTMRDTLDEIDTLREQSIEVRSRSDSQMFLKIRSFGEKGAEVRTALQEDLREQLGDERYSAFMIMTEDSLNSEYFEFGRAYQTISYNFYNSESTGAPRVRIVDEVHIPQGSGSYTIIQNKDNYDTLPENYATYLEVADSATPGPLPVTPPPAPPAPADQSP